MFNHKHHKIFVGVVGIVFLVIGIFIGNILSSRLNLIDISGITIGLILTNTILILILGSLIVEIKSDVEPKKK